MAAAIVFDGDGVGGRELVARPGPGFPVAHIVRRLHTEARAATTPTVPPEGGLQRSNPRGYARLFTVSYRKLAVGA